MSETEVSYIEKDAGQNGGTTEEVQQSLTYLTCPECGRVFERVQGLATHRSRAHGKRGTSKEARRARERTARANRDGQEVERGEIERRLLRALYPDGTMPVASLPKVRAWLDTAHALRA